MPRLMFSIKFSFKHPSVEYLFIETNVSKQIGSHQDICFAFLCQFSFYFEIIALLVHWIGVY